MRLWHQDLIPHLPRQQLMGQHRECCALRGAGWGRRHATVDYVFQNHPNLLVAYHLLTIEEMKARGYKPDKAWLDVCWRGKGKSKNLYGIFLKQLTPDGNMVVTRQAINSNIILRYYQGAVAGTMIYPEHTPIYLLECLKNLREKGVIININAQARLPASKLDYAST